MTQDRDTSTWYLLARRPGWRDIAALSDLALVDGSYQLTSVAPTPPPPITTCTVAGCGDLAIVDRAGKRVVFVTVDGQTRNAVGPLRVVEHDEDSESGDDGMSGPGVAPVGPIRRLGPTDVFPVVEWPVDTWDPVAVVPGREGRVWVVDAANDLVHELDRRDGWVRALAGSAPPPCAPSVPGAPFALSGRLVVGPLDGLVDACVWDRVAVGGSLPGGGSIALRTLTSDVAFTDAELVMLDELWTDSGTQSTPGDEPWEALVGSGPGRYLWLEIALDGDGAVTPRVDDVEVHFPRDTTARLMPPAYRQGPDGGGFLEAFLALTDSMRRTVTAHLDGTPLLLDPDSTPADPSGDFLAWLSSWLGVDDADTLPVARRRRLLAAAADLYRVRGTPDGVRRHAALWLGRPVDVLEHYRLRRWSVLHAGGTRLGDTSRLFGPAVMRRLQLDEFAEVGAVRLIDVPDPKRDPFHFYAHRFSLVVRARRTDDVDDLAERAAHIVAIVAPAHSSAEICVVRPELRVGVQATIGLDALVGCVPDPEPLGDGRLDEALVLGGDPTRPGSRLGRSTRVSRTAVQ